MIFELEFSRIYLIAFAAGSASEAQPTMARPAHTAKRASNFSALLKRVFFFFFFGQKRVADCAGNELVGSGHLTGRPPTEQEMT